MSDERNPADDAARFEPVPASEHVSEHEAGHDAELVSETVEAPPAEHVTAGAAAAEHVPAEAAPAEHVRAEPAPAVPPAADVAPVEPVSAEPAPAPFVAPESATATAVASETTAIPAGQTVTSPPAEVPPVAYPAAAYAAPAYAAPAYPAGAYPPAARPESPVAPDAYPPAGGTYPSAAYAVPSAVVVPVLTPPKKRGNRKIGTLIALLGTLIYAVVYLLVAAIILAFSVPSNRLPAVVGDLAASPAFYVPVIFFAIALILLVLIVNRAGWWAYVLGGFIVAVIVYGASILGALLAVQAWNFTAADASTFIRSLVMDPLTLAAAIVAREVPIWIGAWISARGKKLKAKNIAEREEYDRKLAEGASAAYQPI